MHRRFCVVDTKHYRYMDICKDPCRTSRTHRHRESNLCLLALHRIQTTFRHKHHVVRFRQRLTFGFRRELWVPGRVCDQPVDPDLRPSRDPSYITSCSSDRLTLTGLHRRDIKTRYVSSRHRSVPWLRPPGLSHGFFLHDI